MIIKKLKFNDYKIIKNFIKRNDSKVPTLKSLKLLDKILNKKSCFNSDGLYFKGKLIGYHSFIEKKIIYKKKKFKILISSNWNVSKKFRNYSITLINKYLKTKSDFYCTTTANKNVSKIWRAFGASGINKISNQVTIFKVTNYQKLIDYYFKRRKIKNFPKFFTFFISKVIKIFFFNKNSLIRNNIFTYKKISRDSPNLETLIKFTNPKLVTPLSKEVILYYQDILKFWKKTKKKYSFFKLYLKIK